jgi:AcrR family transcriptional regulator
MRRVGGSKASLYSYFGSKEGLFSEVVLGRCDQFLQDLQLPQRADAGIERTLAAIATRFLRKISEPTACDLFRIIVSEAPRFPDLAQRFYEQGALRARHELGNYLRLQHEAGRVDCRDPELSAMHFFELVRGPHLRIMLGLSPFPRGQSLERYVEAAVKLFLHGCAVSAAGRGASP